MLGHRGASAAATENSMEAFALAVTMGADGVELDVRRSADGHLVVHHDATLGRTTPDIGALSGRSISSLTAADLDTIGGGRVPLLPAVLDRCHPTLVNIEIKSDSAEPDFDPDYAIADAVVALLAHRADRGDDTLVTSFDLAAIDAVRTAAAATARPIRTGFLIADHGDRLSAIETARAAGHRAIMPHHTMVDAEFMEAAHTADLFVGTWTVNESSDIARMVEQQVDAIISDTPDVALEIVRRMLS